MKISRKEFVKAMALGGAGLLCGPFTRALFADQGLLPEAQRAGFGTTLDKGVLLDWARLKFDTDHNPDNWKVHPHGDLNLIQKINSEATTNISEVWNVADVARMDQISRFPLLFMHAESPPNLSDAEKANLADYLQRGGFLYAEDCVLGYHSYGRLPVHDLFFRRMAEVLPTLIEGAVFKRIPLDHPVFHCYFDLPQGQPHMQGAEHGAHGLFIKNRLVAYLSSSDAHCGWTNEKWFGPKKSREAVKIGTNVYLYALTHA